MNKDLFLLVKASIWGFLVPLSVAMLSSTVFGLSGPVVYLSVVAFLGAIYEFVLKKDDLYLPTAAIGLILAAALWFGYSVLGLMGEKYEVVEHDANSYVARGEL